jgi:CPA2 family monovalent cation:H+ antiporter-2
VVAGVLSFPSRTRFLAALGLAQIGELSFLLARAGYRHQILDDAAYQLVLAVAVITMLVTPAAIAFAPRWIGRLAGSGEGAAPGPPTAGLADHVIVAGFGLNGRHLTKVLRAAGVPYIVVEASGAKVREGRAAGEPMLYGDATRRAILRRCGVESARAAVLAISDPEAAIGAVAAARQLNPGLFIVARSRRVTEIEALQAAGADEVVAEEFETSVEILTSVLQRLHVPGNVIRTQARLLRADCYRMLRTPSPSGLSEPLRRALAVGATDSFLLGPEHAAVGATLRGLELRRRTGATVLAVVRGDQPLTSPAADLELESDDVLVLVGGHAEIEQAFRLLEERRA